MPGGGDGQEFGDTFNDAEEDDREPVRHVQGRKKMEAGNGDCRSVGRALQAPPSSLAALILKILRRFS
jgi:hypothetical protein